MTDLLDTIRRAQQETCANKHLTLIQVGSITCFEAAFLRAVGTLKKAAVETATSLVGVPVQQHSYLPDNGVALWSGEELLTVFSFDDDEENSNE